MGIFSRMGDIINSNLNAMIEAAEDPEKIARLIIQEMEDTLVEVRTDAARHIAERKELTRREDDYRKRADDWAAKAELAITKDREDLARGALTARRQAEDMADVVGKEIEVLDEAIGKADGDLSKLQTKLDEAKAKHKALTMRSTVARSQVKMRTKLVDTRVDDALSRYERMERKVDELEAHVEAFDLGEGESLESQFAALETDDELEDELEALKARMSKPKAANKSEKPSKKAG
ncbi:MAG: phage shock protein PspA [Litorimonas sp.]